MTAARPRLARPWRIAASLAKRGGRRRQGGLRPGLATSILLHLGFAALVVITALQRERPPEPLPPPAYAMYYESGAPDRPAELESPPAPASPEAAPPLPAPPPVAMAPPQTAPPPPSVPRLAEPLAPLPAPAMPVAPPPAPPRPQVTAEIVPAPALPLPPPPPPAPPARDRPPPPSAATAPQPSQRLPGLYLPDGLPTAPSPRPFAAAPRPSGQRAPLDLSLDRLAVIGRASPEARLEVRGAEVGPDWRNAFRRWLDQNNRYPPNALVVNEQGTNRVEILVAPDGRVRSVRLVRSSGSVWLDAGLVSLFRGAELPAFPPGADPKGVTVNLTMTYILINR